MSHSSSTMDRTATISITDIDGNEETLQHFEDQFLAEYFPDSKLSAPTGDQVALMNGLPIDLTAPVPADASIMIGLPASLG